MVKKRSAFAILGLCVLFLCAWFGYYISNAWEKNRGIDECYNTVDETETEIVAVSGRFENYENIHQQKRVKIRSKDSKYRNAQRKLNLSEDDYEALLRIVEAEATGGSIKSKKMVANVILNRVADEHFPNSVTAVVFQREYGQAPQFSPTSDGRYFRVKVQGTTRKAVKEVLDGNDETKGALFFVNRKTANASNVSWFENKLKYLFDCGGHSFYCYKS